MYAPLKGVKMCERSFIIGRNGPQIHLVCSTKSETKATHVSFELYDSTYTIVQACIKRSLTENFFSFFQCRF